MSQFPASITRCSDGSILIEIYGLVEGKELFRIGVFTDVSDPDDNGWYLTTYSGMTNLMGDIQNGAFLAQALDNLLPKKDPE